MAARRAEDRAAMARLGVAFAHWDLVDALYRRDASGVVFYDQIGKLFGTPAPADESAVLASLAPRLADLPPTRTLIVPLGAGRHVDHLLVRRAAEQAAGELPRLASLAHYEELPYARSHWSVRRALERPREWTAETFALREQDLAAKIAAVLAYRSQLMTAYRDDAECERSLRRIAKRRGGERLWRQDSCGAAAKGNP
jgi:LmbE family N-acetylglucosaminyl deacetylase